MKLHRLPTGDWLDLSTVTMIRKNPNSLQLHMGEQCIMITCDSEPRVSELADELAALVNARAEEAGNFQDKQPCSKEAP